MRPDEDMRKYAGSQYLKIEDLADGPLETEIIDIKDGKFDKPVAEFTDGSKLGLNTTNCRVLYRDLGPKRSDWLRHPIELYVGETEFEGKARTSILIRVIDPVPKSKQTPPPAPEPINDEIPF